MTRLFWSLITHEIDSGAPLEMLKTWHSKKTHLVRVRVRSGSGLGLGLGLVALEEDAPAHVACTWHARKPHVRMPCARCNKHNMCVCMYGHAACVWRAHHAKSSKSVPLKVVLASSGRRCAQGSSLSVRVTLNPDQIRLGL